MSLEHGDHGHDAIVTWAMARRWFSWHPGARPPFTLLPVEPRTNEDKDGWRLASRTSSTPALAQWPDRFGNDDSDGPEGKTTGREQMPERWCTHLSAGRCVRRHSFQRLALTAHSGSTTTATTYDRPGRMTTTDLDLDGRPERGRRGRQGRGRGRLEQGGRPV
jgi:hypothetical protein